MRVARITLHNRTICHTAYEKVDAIVAAMQHAPQTVIRCGTDVFKASAIASIDAVDMNEYDLPDHIKNSDRELPAPKNAGIRKLPTDTIILHPDGKIWQEYAENSLVSYLKHETSDFVLATCHYRLTENGREYLLKKEDVKDWLVCSVSEERQPVIHESLAYGVPRF